MITIIDAILAINSKAKFSTENDDITNIKWLEGTTVISKSDIETKLAELQAEHDAKQYQRDRIYPSIQEQLDMQYWDKVNGTTTWKDAIAKVKLDNPKPE
tara:strand:- start:48 stop:347 length:300 start_codon:yes stop_codon:yes gene_type:complete